MSRVTVTITGLLKDLDEGLKRPDIATKYGITLQDVHNIFKHDKLKGKKARMPPGYILIDDTDDINTEPTPLGDTPDVKPEPESELFEVKSEPQKEPEKEPEQSQATTDSLI